MINKTYLTTRTFLLASPRKTSDLFISQSARHKG